MKPIFTAALLMWLLLGTTPAVAGVSIDITDVPAQSQSFIVLPFVASESSTFVAFGGYNVLSYSQATQIAINPLASNENLLGLDWILTEASTDFQDGLYADQFDDSAHGTGANGVEFGSTVIGSFDYFSQYVSTTPGNNYVLSFLFSQDYPGANGFIALVDESLSQNPASPADAGNVSGLQNFARFSRNSDQSDGPLLSVAVPEPSTWMLILAGFGLMGFALRHKRRPRNSASRLGQGTLFEDAPS